MQQTIIKPRRVVPDYVIQYEQNKRIAEILEPHRQQLEQGMTPEEILMPLLERWQAAYAKQGINLSVDDVLIFLMRGTYPQLLTMESKQ
ncbi:hypothetical protein WIA93_10380 [Citrobacter amalonaticus]|uniref:hypothetical protein n=1 Tax=Citrobacter amalonaticus TaxID=35703 RepID=UPI001157A087|nr:hypothetical protein [Citrobacter amalonaticus]QDK86580.1 hypothetical protein FEO47_14310 [Citrobacter amalonaticus]